PVAHRHVPSFPTRRSSDLVMSLRRGQYSVVEAFEAPDAETVIFRLKHPSAGFLSSLASPWNWIYKADILAKDPHWYEKNILGSGDRKSTRLNSSHRTISYA